MKGPFASVVQGLKLACRLVVRQQRGCSTAASSDMPSPPWDIMFFGTDEFSLKSLKVLHQEQRKGGLVGRLEVVTVSLKKPEPAVRLYCCIEGVPLHTWPLPQQPCGFQVGVVASFGHLIPAKIITAFPFGIINIHGSLLPRWRGAAPVIHALLHGDTHTGITIMRIRPTRFDVGSIVSQAVVPVAWDTKCGALTNELADLGATELISVLNHLPEKLHNAVPQPDIGITKAPKVSEATSRLRWSEHTCHDIQAMFRALDDHFPLWTQWQETPVKLRGMVMRQEWSKGEGSRERCESDCRLDDKRTGWVQGHKSERKVRDHDGVCDHSEIGRTENLRIIESTKVLDKENIETHHQDGKISENGEGRTEYKEINMHISNIESDHNLPRDKDRDTSLFKHTQVKDVADNGSDTKVNVSSMETVTESPGTIIYSRKLKLVQVRCVDGWVSFQQVVVKGRKPMNAQDFYNGFISKVPRNFSKFT